MARLSHQRVSATRRANGVSLPNISVVRHERIMGRTARPWIMRLLRRIHATVGIVSTLNILLLIGTGLLIQNRETFRLEDKYVSHRLLPSSYRPRDVELGVRSDIVVTDLHSGRILGQQGVWIVNGLAVAWLVLAVSGVVMYGNKLRVNGSTGRAE